MTAKNETLTRCKACGLVIAESKLKDKCPACGLKRTVFEPYKEKVSKRRKQIMDLYLHPIAVHFPQAFTAIVPLLIIAALFAGEAVRADLLTTVKVLTFLLPATVLGAFVLGIVDGKNRFKKLLTPYLKIKIALGILLIVLTLALFFIVWISRLQGPVLWAVFTLYLVCVICEGIMGKIGGKMLVTRING